MLLPTKKNKSNFAHWSLLVVAATIFEFDNRVKNVGN